MEVAFLEKTARYLIEGETKKALETLYANVTQLRDFEENVVFQLSRWNRLEKDIERGFLPYDQQTIQQNRVSNAVQSIFYDIKEHYNPAIVALMAEPSKSGTTKSQVLEKLVGGNQLKEIAWLYKGLQYARSVCRIATTSNKPVGTGFLIGDNCILTNNHVIDDQTDLSGLVAQFDYEYNTDGQLKEFYNYPFAKSEFFKTSHELDYTKIALKEAAKMPELVSWGNTELKEKLPKIGDHVTIIQHPQGWPKQIALNENEVTTITEKTIEYTTDTLAGSSGSPVFDDDWKVIGLHRAASSENDANIATQMGLIISDLAF